MRRFGLRDDQWERIKDLLPGRAGSVGVTAVDNRLFVEAVLYRYRTGMPWRDLPERFGEGPKVHLRFSRWAKSGVWERIPEVTARRIDQHGPLPDQQVSCAMVQKRGLLIRRLHRYKPHARPSDRLADRLSVRRISLAATNVRLDAGRRDQPHLVAGRFDQTSPVVCGRASLDAHQAVRQTGEETSHLRALEFSSHNHSAVGVDVVDLKHSLSEI